MADEAKLTVTLKSEQHNGPWIVVRGDSPVELQSMLEAISSNGLGAVVANADTAFKAGINVGGQLGATPVEAPQNPQASEPQQSSPWGQAPQQQSQQGSPWGQSPQQAEPAPAQAGSFDTGGAPVVLGMPARKVTGTSKRTGRPWAAWADPRPKEATQHINDRTDDPNDPRLAAGQVQFWRFIR